MGDCCKSGCECWFARAASRAVDERSAGEEIMRLCEVPKYLVSGKVKVSLLASEARV